MRRKRAREQEAKDRAAAEATAPATLPSDAPVPTAPLLPDRVDALTEAIGGELGRLRGEMRGRDADLVQALQQVAASYDRVAARLDDERRVQTLLAEALVRIDRRLGSIERQGVAALAVEGPVAETPALEGPAVDGPTVEGPAGDGRGTPPREELPRPQRVIGGSIAPRQDIPRRDG